MAADGIGTSRRSRASGRVLRSLSPSGKFHLSISPSCSPSSTAFASSSSRFVSRPSSFFTRSASPTRVNMNGHAQASVRFSLDRPISPNRSISAANTSRGHHHNQVVRKQSTPKKTCMCSPTTHPGSFRCSLHKSFSNSQSTANCSPSNRLNARRSAMTNSLVRIGGVEGDLVKRALAALIRPTSHQQRRRAAFHPRPSRLSAMSKAENL